MYFDTCYSTEPGNVYATLDNFSRKCSTQGMPIKIIPGNDDYVPAFPAVSPEF